MMNAIEAIAAERSRQIVREGYDESHDDGHEDGEIALAAALYATPIRLYEHKPRAACQMFMDPWPWEQRFDKRPYDGNVVLPNSVMTYEDRRLQLVKAGALIVAEIERLDRAHTSAQGTK